MKITKMIRSLLLRNEKWLPIVNESGTVYGKIAYSRLADMKNEYLHPIVRIALVHNGQLFLNEKESRETNDKPCLDYPFERHVMYRETLDESISKVFESNGSEPDINSNCNFLFRYIHRSEKTQRLVYFYICNIRNNGLLKKLNLSNGKWWTRKQIKDNLKTGLFSAFFENEFEFLDSTILAINNTV